MGYKFKKYSSLLLPSLTALLDKSFSIENSDKEGLVKWKYFDKFLKGKTITYLALDENNNVISHYTNIPFTISYSGKSFKSMICTDMCTDKKNRGKGLISQLSAKVYEEVKNKGYDFSLGFSNDAGVKVDKYASSYGYVIPGKFVRYFKFVVYRKNIQYQLIKTNNFNKELSDYTSNYLKVKKDYDYLYWRYVKKPNSEYDIYNIVNNNKIIGYVVLRFLRQKCYIYDIVTVGDDKKHMITVLRSIENKALDHGVRIIIYNVLDNNYWKSLFNKYKYFKRVNNNINYYLTVKIHNKNLPCDLILNKENWLLMNGDIL